MVILLEANQYSIMKRLYILILFIMAACGKPSEQKQDQEAGSGDNPNQALYDQVMDIHDEVMPHMDDIEKLKRELKEEIANSPEMVAERKAELEQVISNLDSAGNAMMDWMHKFNPLPDSADQETSREYLETEMERIKKVRDLMNESLEKAKGVATKK
jgi:Mg2+ and Co2+ transporter CorA